MQWSVRFTKPSSPWPGAYHRIDDDPVLAGFGNDDERERNDVIGVRRTGDGDPLAFEVVVREGKGESRHQVTMARGTCERLTAGKHAPERLIEAAFRFLLEREPKESILGRFDVTLISRYFPEFERELPKYLSRR